jgi:acyl-CoA thioester hydrolase
MSNSDRWSERHVIAIVPADIDHMGHVNNSIYLRWVQEAVLAHWERIAPEEAFARHLWVALKHEITYRKAALLDDNLVAVAELQSFKGARSTYRTQINRGDECIAEAFSNWCSIDAKTGCPLRLDRDLASWMGINAHPVLMSSRPMPPSPR